MDFIAFFWSIIGSLMQEIDYITHADNHVEMLNNRMEDLKAKQSDILTMIASGKRKRMSCTEETQRWLRKVALKEQEVDKIKEQTNQRGSFFTLPSMVSRRAVKAHTEVKDLIDERASLNDIVLPSVPETILEKQMQRTMGMAMELNLEKIRNYLRDDNVGIVGIWGMGGVGKTTLITKLNNSMLGGGNLGFKHVIYVVASQDLQLKKLHEDIAKKLGLSDSSVDSIFNFLKNESFLLLVDDLWENLDLNQIGIPHPRDASDQGSQKQKVVLTTRSDSVCGEMGADETIKVECLEQEAAWSLFKQKVRERTISSDVRIESVAKDVAMECAGLPLALIVIGSAMSPKKKFEDWEHAYKSLKNSQMDFIREKDSIFSTLKFSYDSLQDKTIQDCFLCCALWPEDWEIPKIELIECWLGHGLIDKWDDYSRVLYYAHFVIGQLAEACLFDMVGERVKVHDVMRDLAIWIASDCGRAPTKCIAPNTKFDDEVYFKGWSQAERISLIHTEIFLEKRPHWPNLSTFIARNSLFPLGVIPQGFFENISTITFLDLSDCFLKSLPSDILRLVALQYLNLSSTHLESLPDEVGGLLWLRCLILRDMTPGFMIPRGLLPRLRELRVFKMYPTGWVDEEDVGSLNGVLKALETVSSLSGLRKHLSQLPIFALSLRFDYSAGREFHLLRDLRFHTRMNLTSFRLSGRYVVRTLVIDDGGFALPKLEELTIEELPGLKEIIWTRGVASSTLCSLRILVFNGCKRLKNITWVGELPNLVRLDLSRCEELEQIIGEKNDGSSDSGSGAELNIDKGSGQSNHPAFPKLQVLKLRHLWKLREISARMMSFPALKLLLVSGCIKLKKLPFTAEIARNKLTIRCEEVWWDHLEWEDESIRSSFSMEFRSLNEDWMP